MSKVPDELRCLGGDESPLACPSSVVVVVVVQCTYPSHREHSKGILPAVTSHLVVLS